MTYKPNPITQALLDRAWEYVNSVPYTVTARWLFYRLLQDAILGSKSSYKTVLSYLSKARKNFYAEWRPDTLADDTRAPVLMQRMGYYGLHFRGNGFKNETEWLKRVKDELNCPLDRWASQAAYIEIWFEAAAMQAQFLYYADENIPLLAFHGDVSIPEKWRTAKRLAQRYKDLGKPIHIYYFGDYDPKGLLIPMSAWKDIGLWAGALMINDGVKADSLGDILHYHRVGINAEHIDQFGIPENPERPGAYQWEALDDSAAQQLIEQANEYLDQDALGSMVAREDDITQQFRDYLEDFELEEDT